ncbi:conserved hypothetical protein [uncultured Stenotrophomonas sp.]|uniref:Uncharacterized protein n=1 Tax=uncultured Stenotrophomonas sp. TaxID=165438 RepID=A0A1Y5Q5W1_9GAMM|nr:conserved hypothetical protein [uncultured Stenotrophomonas sp.]
MKSPSEELVEVIFPVLEEKGLLLPEDILKSKTKIVTGTMKAEDWLLVAENAVIRGENP